MFHREESKNFFSSVSTPNLQILVGSLSYSSVTNWVARMRQMVCLAGLLLLTLDTAAGFSMAGVPRVVHAHKASVGRRGAPWRPRVCAMASSSTADDPTKRPITKLRLIQHKAEAFWFYR